METVEGNANFICKIIKNEANILGGDYSKIFIGGFSQGCSMSFYIALTHPKLLGGALCLSCKLFPETRDLIKMLGDTNPLFNQKKADMPFFIYMGTKDHWFKIEEMDA
jgi:predicted esterase